MYKDGDDPDVTLEGSANLKADEVARLTETPPTRRVGGRQPLCTDHCQQHIAAGDSSLDLADEVRPGRNLVDVHEDASVTEAHLEVVVEPTGRVRGIFATVADEDR